MNNKQIKGKISNFWNNGLSIDETRVSILIASLIFVLIFAAISYFDHGDFPPGVVETIKYLIFGITGINVGKTLLSNNSSSDETKDIKDFI